MRVTGLALRAGVFEMRVAGCGFQDWRCALGRVR